VHVVGRRGPLQVYGFSLDVDVFFSSLY